MLLVTGRKYSGKSTIKNRLAREKKLKNVTVYTTRKKMPQDVMKKYYRFITSQEFEKMKEQGKFKFVTTNSLGELSGFLSSDFERSDTILELDFSTLMAIIGELPQSCKVVFVDAATGVRFDRMVKDTHSIPEAFNVLHTENFKGYDLPFGIVVDNSLNDGGKTATINILSSLEQYNNRDVIQAESVKAKRKYITPLASPQDTTNIRKFLAYEQWAIQDIRRTCNLSSPDGREFAKSMYRNYLSEFKSLTLTETRFDSTSKEISIILDGMHFPLAKDESFEPEPRGTSRVKSIRER